MTGWSANGDLSHTLCGFCLQHQIPTDTCSLDAQCDTSGVLAGSKVNWPEECTPGLSASGVNAFIGLVCAPPVSMCPCGWSTTGSVHHTSSQIYPQGKHTVWSSYIQDQPPTEQTLSPFTSAHLPSIDPKNFVSWPRLEPTIRAVMRTDEVVSTGEVHLG